MTALPFATTVVAIMLEIGYMCMQVRSDIITFFVHLSAVIPGAFKSN